MQHEITFALYAAIPHHKIIWNDLSRLKLEDPLRKLLSSFSFYVSKLYFLILLGELKMRGGMGGKCVA